MDKLKEKHGITLIALVITIIILLILAGILIAALTGENGLITKAKEATAEYKKAQSKEELQLKISEMQLKITSEESREATLKDFNDLIEKDEELTFITASYDTTSTEMVQGEIKLIKVLYKNNIFTVNSALEIIDIEENDNIAKVDLNYEIKEKEEINGKVTWKILLKFQSNEKITKVQYGEQILKSDVGIEEIAIDFDAENKVEYVFKVTTITGKEVEKTLIIDKEILTGIKLNKSKVYLGFGKEEILQLNILPENSYYKSIKWTIDDNTLATVDDNGKVVANKTKDGTATITVTVQDMTNSYSETCEVNVIDEIERTGYIIDITGIQAGNCSAINEIEFYNSNNELLSEHYDSNGNRNASVFNNFKLEVYDSHTKNIPAYWNRGTKIWGKELLFDGKTTYGSSSSAIFMYEDGINDWSRLFIYDLSEEVDHIKIYSGGKTEDSGRYPVELSVYRVNGYKTKIVNENLKSKDNDANMTSWGTQTVSKDTSAIAENTFTNPK